MGTLLLEALAAASGDEGIAKFSALADLPPASRQAGELLRLAAREEAAVASRS